MGIPYTLENFNSWEAKKNIEVWMMMMFSFVQMGDFEVTRQFSACNRVVDFPYVLSSQSHEFSGCVHNSPHCDMFSQSCAVENGDLRFIRELFMQF